MSDEPEQPGFFTQVQASQVERRRATLGALGLLPVDDGQDDQPREGGEREQPRDGEGR